MFALFSDLMKAKLTQTSIANLGNYQDLTRKRFISLQKLMGDKLTPMATQQYRKRNFR